MTEKDIAKSINKHSVKPILAIAFMIITLKILNVYFFDNDPISPILVILFSIYGCMNIVQKVLVDLLVTSTKTNSIKE